MTLQEFREYMLSNPHMYVALDEHGRMHSFSLIVGHDLRDRGVLWRDHAGHWRVRERDANAILENDPDVAVCDFCNARPVTHICDVADFRDSHFGHSHCEWLACEDCGSLVEAGNVEAVFQRAAEAQADRFPMPLPPAAMHGLVEYHELFWANLKGVRRL